MESIISTLANLTAKVPAAADITATDSIEPDRASGFIVEYGPACDYGKEYAGNTNVYLFAIPDMDAQQAAAPDPEPVPQFDWNLYPADTSSLETTVNDFISQFRKGSQGKGLFIYNNKTGSGKTFLAEYTRVRIMNEHHLSSTHTETVSVYKLIGIKFPDKNVMNCELLTIDDIGKPDFSAYDYSKSAMVNHLFSIIDERCRQHKHTILCSSITLEQLNNTYSGHLASLIHRHFNLLHLPDIDIELAQGA